jgi:hypothetical protein
MLQKRHEPRPPIRLDDYEEAERGHRGTAEQQQVPGPRAADE